MSDMFCETCIGVLHHHRHAIGSPTMAGELDDGTKTKLDVECIHHLTCESLIAAASSGCPACRTTWEYLSGPQQDLLRASRPKDNVNPMTDASPSDFITSAKLADWWDTDKLAFTIKYNKEMFPELENLHGHFILQKEEDTLPQHVHIKDHFTANSTSSHESLQTAATWLRDCAQSHTQCNTLGDGEQWYPTRLLHLVGSRGDEGYVSLIRTAEQPPDGPYATLSHCWGNVRPLQLTHAMSSDSHHRFLMADMPKTFQEAIQVCMELGIQYLWIDSLCIIQEGDDRSDWSREAGLMNKVYMHSYLNIAAADADDSTKGLFRNRVPLPVGFHRVSVNTNTLVLGGKFVDYLMADFFLWLRNPEGSRLNKRGWVFQERFLAPRILSFCRNQLFWECKEQNVCETFPKELPMVNTFWSTKSKEAHERKSDTDRLDAYVFSWIKFWDTEIVRRYSDMELTVSTDKLIALSGIAKHFMTRIEDDYVAGMWSKYLEYSLLWYVAWGDSQIGSLRPRPTPYRAPSWSWASVDALVYYCEDSVIRKNLIYAESVGIGPETDDIFGAVASGFLDLRGSLKPMTLYEVGDAEWHMAVSNPVISEPNDMTLKDVLMISNIQLDVLPGDVSTLSSHNTQGLHFFMPCALDPEPPTAAALNLEPSMQAALDKLPRMGVHCLLFKLVDTEIVLFERIGFVRAWKPDEIERLLADLDEETKARLPCLRYENGEHTIRII